MAFEVRHSILQRCFALCAMLLTLSALRRGALRRGIPRDEVEMIHSAIAEVCEACGLKDVRLGMPTVADVEVQKEEGQPSS